MVIAAVIAAARQIEREFSTRIANILLVPALAMAAAALVAMLVAVVS